MKKIDLGKLQANPVLAARAGAGKPTTTFTGYVRSAAQDQVALSADQAGDQFIEIPRSSIVAVFENDNDPDTVTLIVHNDAEVRHVRTSDAATAYLGIGPGEGGCAITCTSREGGQTCCCGVGEKCVLDGRDGCHCESAGPGYGAIYGGSALSSFPGGGRWVYVP